MIKTIRIIGSYSMIGASVYLLLNVVSVVASGGIVDLGNPPHVYQYEHFVINKGSYIFTLFSAILACIAIFLLWPYRLANKVYLITHSILVSYTATIVLISGVFYVLPNFYGNTYA